MTTDTTSTSIDVTVIEALRAQTRRYDVAIDDELVLSVQPNGVKTWTWVHDDSSDPHRKTLGIYPDMSLEDARKSLAAERRSYRRAAAAEKPEFVIRDGRIESARPKSRLPAIAGAAVALIAVGIIAFILIGGEKNSPASEFARDNSVITTEPADAAVQPPTVVASPEDSAPAAGNNSIAGLDSDLGRNDQVETAADGFETVTATTAADSPAHDVSAVTDGLVTRSTGALAGLDRQLDESRVTQPDLATETADAIPEPAAGDLETTDANAPIATATASNPVDSNADTETTLDTNPTPRVAVDTDAIATNTANAESTPDAATPRVAADTDTNATNTASTSADGQSTMDAAAQPGVAMNTDADNAIAAGETETRNTPETAPVSDDSTPTVIGMLIENVDDGLVLDSRVARGNLTSAVNAREPVDDLGATIIGNGLELQTYYFFTELRDLGGQRIRHRWLHRNRIVAEVPFNIGEAWRWRVYSSKDFILPMSGSWHVQVLLDDDTVIYSLPFTFTP